MAKSSSPIRLEASLMDAAAVTGSVMHRSAAEQIEFWAAIGRVVSQRLSPNDLVAFHAGLKDIRLAEIPSVPVDPGEVFAELEIKRSSGVLASTIAGNNIRYQSAMNHPGYLEQVHPDGRLVVGKFLDGQFVESGA